LDEVYFPSITICNLNNLRRSFIYSMINDEKLKALNVTFSELQKVIHLVFIVGEDYEMTPREKLMVEGKFSQIIFF